jgi:hypothetical protein
MKFNPVESLDQVCSNDDRVIAIFNLPKNSKCTLLGPAWLIDHFTWFSSKDLCSQSFQTVWWASFYGCSLIKIKLPLCRRRSGNIQSIFFHDSSSNEIDIAKTLSSLDISNSASGSNQNEATQNQTAGANNFLNEGEAILVFEKPESAIRAKKQYDGVLIFGNALWD